MKINNGKIYGYFNLNKFIKDGIPKYYIGQTTKELSERSGKNGRGYRVNDLNCNSKFAVAIRKWGWESFVPFIIIDNIETQAELDYYEIFYIKYYDSLYSGYNSTIGGSGILGCNYKNYLTKEQFENIRKKISESQIQRFKDPQERINISNAVKEAYKNPIVKENLRISKIVRYSKESEHIKLSIAQKNNYLNNPDRAKKHSEFMKKYFKDEKNLERVINFFKEIWNKEGYREIQREKYRKRFEKQSERDKCGSSGGKNPNSIKLYCFEFDKEFDCIKDAVKFLEENGNKKVNRGTLSSVARGTNKKDYYGEINGEKLHWKVIGDTKDRMFDRFKDPNERKKCVSNNKQIRLIEFNMIFESIKAGADFLKENNSKKHDKSSLRVNINNNKPYGEINGVKLHWEYIKKE